MISRIKALKRFFFVITAFIFLIISQLTGAANVQSLAQKISTEPTLRDKIGQMLVLGFNGNQLTPNSEIYRWIKQDGIGGVILFDSDIPDKHFKRNIVSKSQVIRLNHDLQRYNHQMNIRQHRPDQPLIITTDYEGGLVDRLKNAEGYEPSLTPASFSKLSSQKLSHEIKRRVDELKTSGFNLNLAPLVDVAVNPKNPVIASQQRSFSPDPQIVARFASLMIQALRKQHIQCTLKHFPGHGSSIQDSHYAPVDVTRTFQSYELMPYQKLILDSPHCGVIMVGHIINRQLDPSGLPATLSPTIITSLLRNHLHFKGVVISDDLEMKAITQQFGLEQAVTQAINAGVDVLLFANQQRLSTIEPKKIIDLIEQKVKTGEIKLDRINQAYQRIVELKKTLKSQF